MFSYSSLPQNKLKLQLARGILELAWKIILHKERETWSLATWEHTVPGL